YCFTIVFRNTVNYFIPFFLVSPRHYYFTAICSKLARNVFSNTRSTPCYHCYFIFQITFSYIIYINTLAFTFLNLLLIKKLHAVYVDLLIFLQKTSRLSLGPAFW